MSLLGALRSGVSGLSAQSSAMSIISDNIANVNTTGYKAGSASFSTLVTKQTSSTKYASGGVQCRTRTGIDMQGLLNSTSISTDLGISGNGFFVATQTANPDDSDLWSYTRAGTFTVDNDGYLRNDNGFYLQAWPLMAYDGSSNATLVNIGNNMYMKAYIDGSGNTVLVNDNVIDANNLQPINLNTIGGSAQETQNVQFGGNLPADAPVFDPKNPEAGGRYSSAVLVYDSLGNSHNATLTFTKVESGAWSLDVGMPSGAATLVTYSPSEQTNDAEPDVYSARAQLEFNSIPSNHSTIAMETNGKNYVFEFTTDGTTTYSPKANEIVIPVDLSKGIVTVSDAIKKFNEQIQATMPSAGRFSLSTDGTSIQIQQSNSGAPISFNAGKCTACLQSNANPDPVTNIPTGTFELPEIDWDVKNTARLDFTNQNPANYLSKSITIGTNIYRFSDSDSPTAGGVVTVNISSAINRTTGLVDTVKLVSLLKAKIDDHEADPERYIASGSTLEINPTSTGSNMLVSSGNSSALTFYNTNISSYVGQFVTIGDIAGGNAKRFEFTDNPGITSGTILPNGAIAVSVSGLADKDRTSAAPIAVMNELYNTINSYYESMHSIENLSNYFQVSGSTLVSPKSFMDASGTSNTVNLTQSTLTFTDNLVTDYDNNTVTIDGTTYTFKKGGTGLNEIDLDSLITQQTLQFTAVPTVGDTVEINGIVYEFTNGGGVTTPGNVEVDITGAATPADAMAALGGIAGVGGSITGASLTLSGNTITTTIGTTTEYVDPAAVMTALCNKSGKGAFQTGSSLVLSAVAGASIVSGDFTVTDVGITQDLIGTKSGEGIGDAISIVGKDNGRQTLQPMMEGTMVLTNRFSFNNVEDAQSGSIISAVRFNADGSPKEINVNSIAIEWANGARDMTGDYYESSQISLYLGDANTANGLTQLSGKYNAKYIIQDGAKYGSYTGVSISEDGIVTAIFDNGETRAIAQIPIATFVDANSLEALTGNAWIETTGSGNATLRTAGEGGAGKVESNSLEASTVDIAEEFTDMIVTQRAYSAASKIITTADSMLEELMSLKR